MQIYEVVYDSKTRITMTQDEVQRFILALKKDELVEFKGEWLTKFFKVIVKKENNKGILHDGTPVIRNQWGQWVDKYDSTLELSKAYYPEILSDTVMSEEEYNSQKLLN